ncbi:ATP-dependent helicase [Atopobium sp. oral taxon 810]|uniref:UvrD-helicase domain-containing protein n=1 Tax=Atopobium sp. oral taxon 810 TaxID=712158 RepID=UPI000397EE7B|nr:ATP-dependent helicase [Atopobium sp. oral taxon 810]ERI03838.1 UvrD/REP helicase [Atopobium sp. oral taxon 810 str. F0209]
MNANVEDRLSRLKSEIKKSHEGDESQTAIVFSEAPRVFVTAPAGYGKTKTMTSKIVYQLVSGMIPNPKAILALTFSVAAARKMRNEVDSAIKSYKLSTRSVISNRIFITNYHGLARKLLSLYGNLVGFDKELVNTARMCDEKDLSASLLGAGYQLDPMKSEYLKTFALLVKEHDVEHMESSIGPYNTILRDVALDANYMTYSGLITFAIELLDKYPAITHITHSYYQCVMIDEAQDTNILCYAFLRRLVGPNTHCCFFGDPLQRVYGFMGALPDFKSQATDNFNLRHEDLSINHRFEPGSNLQRIDKVIRSAIGSAGTSLPQETAELPIIVANSFEEEYEGVCAKATHMLEDDPDSTVAVLVNRRGDLAKYIENNLAESEVSYFNGLFLDDSSEYASMCDACLRALNLCIESGRPLTTPEAKDVLKKISNRVAASSSEYASAYSMLVDALAKQVVADCRGMDPAERYEYIVDVFATRSLRRYSEYINAKLTLSTVHSAKGLEWDHVIVAGVNREDFPFFTICKSCQSGGSYDAPCQPPSPPYGTDFLSELNIWYVALTRARKSLTVITSYQTFISKRNWLKQTNPSCLLFLPRLSPVTANG